MLTRLMPMSSALRLILHRDAAIVRIFLKRSSSACHVRPHSSDLDCLKQTFLNEQYLPPFDLKPKVIIDGGANIGAASIYFAKKFPEATIFAVEPEVSNYELLKKNCAELTNVVPLRAALWPRSEPLAIEEPDAEKWAFSVRKVDFGESSIRGIAIDELMQEVGIDHIDLLKLDIEGAEKELFESISTNWLDRVNTIVIELHDRFKPGCAQAFYSALHGRRFTQEIRGENIFVQLSQTCQVSK